jgi:hypothetical protein
MFLPYYTPFKKKKIIVWKERKRMWCNYVICFSVCYGFIIGTKNKVRNEIEKCTNTRINIPGQGRVGDIGK